MRKFIYILITLVIFSLFVLLSMDPLKDLISENTQTFEHDNLDVNLGFVIEKFDGKRIEYKINNQTVGEYIKIIGKEHINKICEQLGMIINVKYNVNDIEVIEGFSALLKYKTNMQNNVQIAIINDEIIVANPIIFGSY